MQKKRNKTFLIVFALGIICIVALYFLQSRKGTVPLVNIIPKGLVPQKADVRIQTTPPGASIKIDGIQKQTAPYLEAGLDKGPHNIRAELSGYITANKFINIDFAGSEEIVVNIDLHKVPEYKVHVSNRAVTKAHEFNSQDGTDNYIVFVDPFSRKFVIKKDGQDYGLFPERLDFIEQLFWLDHDRAIAINGKFIKDKVAYIVDFSPWHKKSAPTLTQLSQIGVAFTQGPNPDQLAFLGNLDVLNAKSDIGIVNTKSKQVNYLPNIEIIGGRELYWSNENVMYLAAEPSHGEAAEQGQDEYVVYKIEKKSFGWEKTLLREELPANLSIEPITQTLSYIKDNILHIVDLTTGNEKTTETNINDINMSQETIPTVAYDSYFVVYAYQANSKRTVIKYIDIRNNEEGMFTLAESIKGNPVLIQSVDNKSLGILTDQEEYYSYSFDR